MTLRRATGSLLLAAALLVGGVPAAVAAEPTLDCPADGATVVVDFGELSGKSGLRAACDDEVADERAEQSIVDAGFELTYTTSSVGFVCRVDGVPSEDPCQKPAPADAYWSVWWAAPGGEWTYSSRGVGTLRTPEGGHVALVWHSGDSEAAPPDVSPGAAPESTSADEAPIAVATPDGLPSWVAPAVVLVLLGAVASVVVLRRRRA